MAALSTKHQLVVVPATPTTQETSGTSTATTTRRITVEPSLSRARAATPSSSSSSTTKASLTLWGSPSSISVSSSLLSVLHTSLYRFPLVLLPLVVDYAGASLLYCLQINHFGKLLNWRLVTRYDDGTINSATRGMLAPSPVVAAASRMAAAADAEAKRSGLSSSIGGSSSSMNHRERVQQDRRQQEEKAVDDEVKLIVPTDDVAIRMAHKVRSVIMTILGQQEHEHEEQTVKKMAEDNETKRDIDNCTRNNINYSIDDKDDQIVIPPMSYTTIDASDNDDLIGAIKKATKERSTNRMARHAPAMNDKYIAPVNARISGANWMRWHQRIVTSSIISPLYPAGSRGWNSYKLIDAAMWWSAQSATSPHAHLNSSPFIFPVIVGYKLYIIHSGEEQMGYFYEHDLFTQQTITVPSLTLRGYTRGSLNYIDGCLYFYGSINRGQQSTALLVTNLRHSKPEWYTVDMTPSPRPITLVPTPTLAPSEAKTASEGKEVKGETEHKGGDKVKKSKGSRDPQASSCIWQRKLYLFNQSSIVEFDPTFAALPSTHHDEAANIAAESIATQSVTTTLSSSATPIATTPTAATATTATPPPTAVEIKDISKLGSSADACTPISYTVYYDPKHEGSMKSERGRQVMNGRNIKTGTDILQCFSSTFTPLATSTMGILLVGKHINEFARFDPLTGAIHQLNWPLPRDHIDSHREEWKAFGFKSYQIRAQIGAGDILYVYHAMYIGSGIGASSCFSCYDGWCMDLARTPGTWYRCQLPQQMDDTENGWRKMGHHEFIPITQD
jgi:hypothetical protein